MTFLKESRIQSLLILIGIAVGVAVTVFLSALMQGLQTNTINRTLGTQAHIRLIPPNETNIIYSPPQGVIQLLQEDKREQRLRSINNWQQTVVDLDNQKFLTAVSPIVSGPAFARKGKAQESVVLIGIYPDRYNEIIPIQKYIKSGNFKVSANDIILGYRLAQDLGVNVGSKLRIDTGQQESIVLNISGIFNLGVRDIDERYIYIELKQAQTLLNLPGAVTQIDLTINDIFDAESIAIRLHRLTTLKTESWIANNSQLMSALSAQSLSKNIIILFVSISVALAISSVLSISVIQRTREIGILRATGTTRNQIMRIFLFQGAMLGLIGALIGILISFFLILLFNYFGPRLFYIPFSAELIFFALTLATFSGTVAAALPSLHAARLDPVEAIRYV